MEVLHENYPLRVVQRPEMDSPTLMIADGYTIPASKSDNVHLTLLQAAMTLGIGKDDMIEIADLLAEYIEA